MKPVFIECPICGSDQREEKISFAELVFVRCAACGLIYKSAELADLRSRFAKAYDGKYFIDGQAQYLKRWEHRVAKCRRQLLMCLEHCPAARSVLDVGSSAGYVLAAAESLGLQATGLDYAAYAAQLGKQRGFPTVTASLTQLPFKDASFDILTAKHTLEHVDAAPGHGAGVAARGVRRQGDVAASAREARERAVGIRARRGPETVDDVLAAHASAARDSAHRREASALMTGAETPSAAPRVSLTKCAWSRGPAWGEQRDEVARRASQSRLASVMRSSPGL